MPMNDLISRSALKKYMNDYRWEFCMRGDFAKAVEMVDCAPTVDAGPKWISVEERLPENGQEVLCWYEYFRFGDYNRMYRTYGIGYCFNGYWGGEVSNGQRCKVLAWMPLPEPPGEQKPKYTITTATLKLDENIRFEDLEQGGARNEAK